jgi:hypothetical protein
MRSARKQAEGYARALDEWPPFLIVVDVGNVIELYADFSRQGKNYAQFPDRNSFRVGMADLRDEKVRERLRQVWLEPFALDPAKRAAEVTQDIAALLAEMTKTMERRAPSDDPVSRAEWAYKVSKFLMRCIFAMFAEDIGLLPKGAFLKLIEQHKGKASRFHIAANNFFGTMDSGGYSPAIQEDMAGPPISPTSKFLRGWSPSTRSARRKSVKASSGGCGRNIRRRAPSFAPRRTNR